MRWMLLLNTPKSLYDCVALVRLLLTTTTTLTPLVFQKHDDDAAISSSPPYKLSLCDNDVRGVACAFFYTFFLFIPYFLVSFLWVFYKFKATGRA